MDASHLLAATLANERFSNSPWSVVMTATNFWLILTIAALLWYFCVTLYVSFKGVADIKNMLRRLKNRDNDDPPREA